MDDNLQEPVEGGPGDGELEFEEDGMDNKYPAGGDISGGEEEMGKGDD